MEESLFLRALLKDRVKLRPWELNCDVRDVIGRKLRDRVDGVCTRHGFVRPGSVDIVKVSMGRVEMAMLNGDVTYQVQYCADVCNPLTGSVVRARIVNMNKFGILCEAGVVLEDGRRVPVLEIIVARQSVSLQSDVDLETLHINDDVHVEVLAKKFSVGALKISVVGRVVAGDAQQAAPLRVSRLSNEEDTEQQQEESDNADDSGDMDDEDDDAGDSEEEDVDVEGDPDIDGPPAGDGDESGAEDNIKAITLVGSDVEQDSEGGFYDTDDDRDADDATEAADDDL